MKIEATQSKVISVDINDHEIRKIILGKYEEVFDLTEDMYIEDGKLMKSVESWGGSHSWYDEEKVRDATPEDEMAVIILKKFALEL